MQPPTHRPPDRPRTLIAILPLPERSAWRCSLRCVLAKRMKWWRTATLSVTPTAGKCVRPKAAKRSRSVGGLPGTPSRRPAHGCTPPRTPIFARLLTSTTYHPRTFRPPATGAYNRQPTKSNSCLVLTPRNARISRHSGATWDTRAGPDPEASTAFSIKTGILATTALALLTSVVGLSF